MIALNDGQDTIGQQSCRNRYTKIESEHNKLGNLMCLEKRSLIKKWAVQIREKVIHRNLEWFKPLLKRPRGARGV